jgi:peptidoglycan-N-acetylmuramic acid deacetylase
MAYIEQYNGYYVDRKHGDDCEEKVIYLTFDAGYENGNIEKILDVMSQKQVKGAFFVLSNLVDKNTDLVIRMADEGHLVCNHTSTHKDMSQITDIEEFGAELTALENLYKQKTGREVEKYFRFPEGRFNERAMDFANKLGYKSIFWSFAYADWDNGNQMTASAAKKKIFENIHNGAVILLHPTSATNAEILGEVIDELASQGYRFGTLDELCA